MPVTALPVELEQAGGSSTCIERIQAILKAQILSYGSGCSTCNNDAVEGKGERTAHSSGLRDQPAEVSPCKPSADFAAPMQTRFNGRSRGYGEIIVQLGSGFALH